MNLLASETSPYLKQASRQKIHWMPWSEEAFKKARIENKPVFLSSGAIWCHWCHVMAKECFEDEETANILNAHFVAIKLDRDERPDLDRRYQNALALMGINGGWPLNMFLTPDKKPFYGGTYFPPEEKFGRPGFKRILITIANMYKERKDEIIEYSEKIIASINQRESEQGDISRTLVEKAIKSIILSIDGEHGGFGLQPKFPMSGAIEFLLNRHCIKPDERIGDLLKITLTRMARGGFHDQLRGGFHRYSTDRWWIIPHFEKMLDDNAWLLRNYVTAYALFHDDYFKEIALGIISFMKDELGDPQGGFYASQDADVTPDDEGGYFTWTDEEFKSLLSDEAYEVLRLHYFDERAIMHHDSSKRVLCYVMDPEEIAKILSKDIQNVKDIITFGKKTLLQARERREKPIIDRTLYTSLNGMAISAFLRSYMLFQDRDTLDYALKSLHRIMALNMNGYEVFHREGLEGFLDDYMNLIDALIGAYEVSGNNFYVDKAKHLMDTAVKKFWDEKGGGFFDTHQDEVSLRLKGIDDTPHPSPNALSIILLLKLSLLTDNEAYQKYAERTLKLFAKASQDMEPYSGFYFCALDMFFNMVRLDLHLSPDSALASHSLAILYPYKTIVYHNDAGYIIPCVGNTCYPPIENIDGLFNFFYKDLVHY